ncbi:MULTISPECIES: PHP domain-containing protein [Thermotoga]|jgi:histidinol-phosphatase (PHP family)|uniref:Histidinol-phosphatase n=1 Tax=Thermotoga neapolitana (strain ATCC 49049 / DSM 4359 / NBRC 107923 / NS-E) TaxID=309803 RepID=B9KAG7_THENN|nr:MULTISPECIES: PHP domain-containing protein [Thermotoga]MDK2785387.1 histidinol-phosphatase family [Thermotoga sp.]HBF10641.1 PHP domain-containing protein [Thermotoga neapolitana]ACM23950.1 histidinol-phosphatase [Thermotoga neapolitana DSM 4359]AJG39976.1 histidinol phosphatase [Thermotoga sp. RQ7]KFZ20993.1 histidinol-phosphatase [Thermotoga neapolitana LA10]
MIDMHLHSTFSYDGKAEVEDIIAQVQKLGINHFCITDHYEYENGKLVHDFNVEEYFLTMDKFDLPRGAEISWDGVKEAIFPEGFDYLLLGVHRYDENLPPDELARDYLERTLYVMERVEFHTLAHLDYPARYANADFKANRDLIEKILRFLVAREKILEVNTAGLFKHGKPNPDYWILEMYWDLGGRFITIGSDAHEVQHIGRGIEEVMSKLRRFNFEYVVVEGKKLFTKKLR